jgi:hypothetical protein
MRRLLPAAPLLALAAALSACPPAGDDVEVVVLAILASEHHKEVDPRLTEFADQVRKRDATLTGFKIDWTGTEHLKLGETRSFKLTTGNQTIDVTVDKERDANGRATLTIQPPRMKEMKYECACGKFFPIATDHYEGKGKDRARLFIAVMAKPCKPPKK